MRFYNVKRRRSVEVKNYKIKKTKNNRYLAVATDPKTGDKLARFVSKKKATTKKKRKRRSKK